MLKGFLRQLRGIFFGQTVVGPYDTILEDGEILGPYISITEHEGR